MLLQYEIVPRNTSGINACETSVFLQRAPVYENPGLPKEPKSKTWSTALNTNNPFLLSPSAFAQFTKIPISA